MDIKCPHCGRQYEVDRLLNGRSVKCPDCEKMFEAVNIRLVPCPDCGETISRRAAVCPKCGAPLSGNASEGSPWNEAEEEKRIAVYHPSAMNYLWWIILGVILLPVLVGLFILIFILIEIQCTSYELTSRRIIIRKGLISKNQNEIWIKDMRAVNFVQSVWQRIIGVGDIAIGTAASAGTEINIMGIADPADVVSKINGLRHA